IFRPLANTIFRAVFEVSTNEVWAVGERAGLGVVAYWNGSGWTEITAPTNSINWEGIWASGSGDVWIVGGNSSGAGIASHWDGTAWSNPFVAPGSSQLFGVSGR